ncbi:MAG: glycosyltransferase family 2 protein [Rhodopirellula sp.]|nr:glycosyltransferase family 2 protein [Rhodopirellula sp.]
MNTPVTISAAIIALNEASNLVELLPKLGWIDDIVVVDAGSSDATVDVARRSGCRVAIQPFDNFASQRNRAIALTRGAWVLSLDADERPTPGLIAEIRDVLPRTRWTAFRIPIHSRIFGRRLRRSGTQNDLPVRLFRRDAARWIGDVHEVLRVSGRTGRLRHGLDHCTQHDLETFLTKMHRYTRLEASARVAAGCPPRRLDRWVRPPREVFRRLIWKHGILDGPEGWAFCLLSGLYEWILADQHRRFWDAEMGHGSGPGTGGEPAREIDPLELAHPLSN